MNIKSPIPNLKLKTDQSIPTGANLLAELDDSQENPADYETDECDEINWDNFDMETMPDDIKEEVLILASHEEIMRARLDDVDFDGFIDADPAMIDKLTSFYYPKAKVNVRCGVVWFSKVSLNESGKWLAVMGAQNEAMLQWYDGRNIIYSNIDVRRLDRFVDGNKIAGDYEDNEDD